MPATSWSTTAASNNSAVPNGAPEGMAPSGVNDVLRQVMADGAVEFQINAIKVLGSVSGTNTITASMTPALTAYSAGMIVAFNPAGNNTGATTLNINSLGALDLFRPNGAPLAPGDLVAGIPAVVVLDSGADDFYLVNPQHQGIPQNSQTGGDYTCVLSDANKHIYTGAGRTVTIPANSSVAYPIGTTLSIVNSSSLSSATIAITSDTLYLAGAGTTGSRTLSSFGIATAVKVSATDWYISGTGLS